ncbi:MAG: DUF4118 domain-containing protein [Lachnospiraceae bacterium]|nr:DUF4118 domain-containing protein [Lachnospiraceae bacterium]
MNKNSVLPEVIKDCLITAGILSVASVICMILQRFSSTDTHVPVLFVLAVLCVSRFTHGYVYGIIASLLGVIGVNYAFTYPYFELNFTLTGYPLTFLAMLAVSLMVCTMTSRIKEQEIIHLEIETEKMRSNLLRSISHDIRTPLTSITGNASAILDNDGKLDTFQKKKLLEDIRREAEWLNRVVENILSITKINSDVAKIRKEPELAEEIVSSAVNKFHRRYPDIPVRVSVPDDALLVPMDAVLIEQVLFNLMENAVLHGETTSRIELQVALKGDQAVFKVEDDGIGIPEDLKPHLFDGTLPIGERSDGAGHNMKIGLSICRSIIEAHGGEIAAEDRKEGGSCFCFELPLDSRQY